MHNQADGTTARTTANDCDRLMLPTDVRQRFWFRDRW